ncbi:MAG: hypothetical protein U0586_16480 [Candidatus Brocadiaceae bacterium]
MTLTMLFDGTQHVVIAVVTTLVGWGHCERSETISLINKLHLLIRSKWDCEILTKKFYKVNNHELKAHKVMKICIFVSILYRNFHFIYAGYLFVVTTSVA